MRTVSSETPLSEIMLRRFEKPYSMSVRSAVRRFCVSIGLLQPGDGRDSIVDILLMFLKARKSGHFLEVNDIQDGFKKDDKNIAVSNVRRQIKRLKHYALVEKRPEGYRLTEFEGLGESVVRMEKLFVQPSLDRIKEYASLIDSHFTFSKDLMRSLK